MRGEEEGVEEQQTYLIADGEIERAPSNAQHREERAGEKCLRILDQET
jgi:hypothetical protein